MTSTLQTIVALALVALALALLLRTWFGKRKISGCGHDSCGAVSPEIKQLQKLVRRDH